MRPLAERDASKLLVRRADGNIEHRQFREITEVLPPRSTIVVNRTRVIHARISLKKPTGGAAEIFLTRPLAPSVDPAVALIATASATWECLLGGRNITVGMKLWSDDGRLCAHVLERHGSEGTVLLTWPHGTLADVLLTVGDIPLPPYIKREADEQDRERYQTVFASSDGSVAAPTASLHFTEETFRLMAARDIERIDVTLHVGLGTFKPVEVRELRDHVMHSERFGITREAVAALAERNADGNSHVTVVGTTALRTLESLFAVGARILRDGPESVATLDVGQWEAFDASLDSATRCNAMRAIVEWMDINSISAAWADTAIMLAPGCRIAMADALVTNFHQPGNTLLLLVAAYIGEQWRDVYEAALQHDYRLLSYGDSSLLFRGH